MNFDTVNRKKINVICSWLCVVIAFVIIYFIGNKLLADDHGIVIQWSLMLTAVGLSFLPLASIIFSRFHDGGWLFSKTIGIAVSGWLTWYLSFSFLSFNRNNCIIILGICAFINYAVYFIYKIVNRQKNEQLTFAFDKNKLFSAVTTEIIFFGAFTLWCYFRGFNPGLTGNTEKFMDYAFMTTMMRSDSMPPTDMWLSGNSINYYYVGQYLAVYMTKLTKTTANYGYNLSLMTIAAFSISLPYTLVYNIVKNSDIIMNKTKSLLKPAFCAFCGMLAGCAVTITANMHYPIYRYILPFIYKLSGKEKNFNYKFYEPTRFIGHNPETTDKTIHEFPSYSFVLGDLHAHVINIIFVMTLLALLYAFLLYRKVRMLNVKEGITNIRISYYKEIFHPAIIIVGFFIGVFNTTNYWDFPIYFVVAGAIILFSNSIIFNFKKDTLIMTALHAVIILTISILVCLPFTLNFKSMTGGIALTVARTPFYQLAILWALPVACVVVFLISQYFMLRKEGKILISKNTGKEVYNKNRKNTMNTKNTKIKVMNRLFQFIKELNISDLYIITIGLCAIGLVIIPEVVYVSDIYSGDYKRANTMFKLTYQAYIMFGIGMGYMIPKLILFMKKKKYTVIGTIMLILLVWTMGYIKEAFNSWYGDVRITDNYKGLDAAAFIKTTSIADYEATNWLNENVDGLPVVLEANGDSYTSYQRVSVITGLPTILGWRTHEWLWRSDKSTATPPIVLEREADIKTIYTSSEYEIVYNLLNKYNVEYIYIGECEREKFGDEINEELLQTMGEVVFWSSKDNGMTYIIKVSNY